MSTQYLEESLLQRLEFELGEKAQSMTERFHAAATKLSASITRGRGGVTQVQQLFLVAQWYKSEASMIESWHALSAAIREAQEISRSFLAKPAERRCVGYTHTEWLADFILPDMHRPMEGLDNFERELRKRLWCILWTWDW